MIKRVSRSVKYKFSLVKTTQDEECMKAAEKKKGEEEKKPRHISLADKTPHPLGTLQYPVGQHDLQDHKSSKSRWKPSNFKHKRTAPQEVHTPKLKRCKSKCGSRNLKAVFVK